MALCWIGVTLISVGLTYALWVKMRVLALRQDIFDARDWLFDRARDLNAFDDPGYRACREYLNAICRHADDLSWSAFGYVCSNEEWKSDHKWIPDSSNADVKAAVDNAVEYSAKRVLRYLQYETLTGWVFGPVLTVMYLRRAVAEKALHVIERWIRSGSPSVLDCLDAGPVA